MLAEQQQQLWSCVNVYKKGGICVLYKVWVTPFRAHYTVTVLTCVKARKYTLRIKISFGLH